MFVKINLFYNNAEETVPRSLYMWVQGRLIEAERMTNTDKINDLGDNC